MKPLACRYSIIQFVPYVETGEFANIGIVLACPQQGFFNYLLQDRRTKRITDFFDALDRGHYKRAVKAVEEELSRIRSTLLRAPIDGRADALRGIFLALTQPREAIVRFSQPRVLMAEDPAQALQDKFDHYVDHSFATPEYIEHAMNARLRSLLGSMNLIAPFKPERIGNDQINAKFDFVQTLDASPVKVIKALNLSHKDPNDIAAHGDVWVGRMGRLKRHGQLPQDILFNVELPDAGETVRYDVGQELMHALERQEIVVVPGHDQDALKRIQEFALG